MENSVRLQMRGVCKRFGATRALNNVNFEIKPGEVHALIGENGAGKSTLMKILSGAYSPDEGEIMLEGKPFAPGNPLHSRKSGIAMIYQELNLTPHLTAEENILLGEEPSKFGWINSSKRRELAQEAIDKLNHSHLPLDKPVHLLSLAEQQVIEIARASIGSVELLIMDEPTSSLTKIDVSNLFSIIKKLRDEGTSIIYISHFLEECQEIADRYTVLRDGVTVGSGAMDEVTFSDLIHLMVGREINEIYPETPHAIGETVMEIRNLAGSRKPRSVNLKLHSGEIFGIAGLVGAGRTETVRACFGLDDVKKGSVFIHGSDKTHSYPQKRLNEGMGLLSENRKEEGLMLNRDAAENLTTTDYGRFTRWGFIDKIKQHASAKQMIDRLDIKIRELSQSVNELSGGNQQKISLGRLLHHNADIYLLDEPTRGIDIASKTQIYTIMGELAVEGKAVIFISSYLPELLGVCDTIGVMCRGVMQESRPTTEWTENEILSVAIGQQADD
jgi:ribose transport system ATP-binding protein